MILWWSSLIVGLVWLSAWLLTRLISWMHRPRKPEVASGEGEALTQAESDWINKTKTCPDCTGPLQENAFFIVTCWYECRRCGAEYAGVDVVGPGGPPKKVITTRMKLGDPFIRAVMTSAITKKRSK